MDEHTRFCFGELLARRLRDSGHDVIISHQELGDFSRMLVAEDGLVDTVPVYSLASSRDVAVPSAYVGYSVESFAVTAGGY